MDSDDDDDDGDDGDDDDQDEDDRQGDTRTASTFIGAATLKAGGTGTGGWRAARRTQLESAANPPRIRGAVGRAAHDRSTVAARERSVGTESTE
ncbi:hypothetical protein DFJ73DRAFT_779781 [Zopfochytrium polystomum]|nr:hypothetical protein DFJ73DRAFT_779781 [Zopfochytrium polystomum]